MNVRIFMISLIIGIASTYFVMFASFLFTGESLPDTSVIVLSLIIGGFAQQIVRLYIASKNKK